MDPHGELTADDVRHVAFSKPPIGKRGYNEDEVDAVLDLVERRLADPVNVHQPKAVDIAGIAFSKPPIGKRGYNEDDVDAFFAAVVRHLERTDGAVPSRDEPTREAPSTLHRSAYEAVPYESPYEAPPLDAPPPRKWWRFW